MTMGNRKEDGPDPYRLRAYRPGDDGAIVALHNRVWGGGRTGEWFRWKYVDAPYADEVPVYLVTRDDRVVGMVGLVPFRMRAGGETGLGLLAGDLVVAPEHRSRGLLRRLLGPVVGNAPADVRDPSRRAGPSLVERADFAFAYANALSHPAMLKLGWSDADPRRTYHRVHDPSRFARDRLGPRVAGALSPVARAGARTWLRVRGRNRERPAGVAVEFHEGLPVETLTALADSPAPEGVHPVHDEAFYEWRFSGPTWSPDGAYVARRGGDPVAAVLVRGERDERLDATRVSLIHTVPLAGREREAGLAAILDRVAADRRDATSLRAWNPVFPDRLLRERGFRADDRPPLSWLGDPDLRLIVYSGSTGPFAAPALAESGNYLWSLDK
jgi:GNAT superfamily N-acetyltransferase